ncbi:hypothetical protein [Gluconobacter sphaericus]|nr:hypothetical protein [Gluconobacter sphaericus]MBS1098288.1 hypothetical protein [Gluconobacter sphaericus]QQX90247.1 hypothetical protein IGS75_08390 [Gluconobacter sphaericus]
MRREAVRGLTTTATIWFAAVLGMAGDAGLSILTIATAAAGCFGPFW